MDKKTILLTGATGFIGKTILNELRKEKIETAYIPHEVLKDLSTLTAVLGECQPTVIIHMAAYGNIITQSDDDETIQANYINLYNLLKASKDVEYEMFVNFSTSSVSLPHDTFYSATKAAGERLCHAYANKYNKNILSVRPFTVIGVGEPPQHLIPTLIRSCLEGERIQFVGEPVHDFIGVNDFVDALRIVIEGWNLKGEVEIGTGIKTTNEEILKIVESVTGKKANIIRVDNMRNYDTMDWVSNPVLIRKLGWRQQETITTIVTDMVNDYVKRRKIKK